jgi:hypothetical protein
MRTLASFQEHDLQIGAPPANDGPLADGLPPALQKPFHPLEFAKVLTGLFVEIRRLPSAA